MIPRSGQLQIALLSAVALAFCPLPTRAATDAAPRYEAAIGSLGGDLGLLKLCYSAPASREGNHYVELWKPGVGIKEITRACGLNNNRALFIHSHGDAVFTPRGPRYAFRAHQDRVPGAAPAPCYSARDICGLVGPVAATNIHNIYVSGCNREGLLKGSDLRRFFPNATNVTHVAAGNPGFEPMFIQALTLCSTDIKPLFETSQKKSTGEVTFSLGNTEAPNAVRMPTYIAELFLPGARQPYELRIAGRDLLSPPLLPPSLAAR